VVARVSLRMAEGAVARVAQKQGAAMPGLVVPELMVGPAAVLEVPVAGVADRTRWTLHQCRASGLQATDAARLLAANLLVG
jgi:hypothetical protein